MVLSERTQQYGGHGTLPHLSHYTGNFVINNEFPRYLFRLQLRILVRGLELLRPGGRLVYSTCSLNPIEDEAVVCTAVKIGKGSIELVDCDSELTGLKRNKGLLHWKVCRCNKYRTTSTVSNSLVLNMTTHQIIPSH